MKQSIFRKEIIAKINARGGSFALNGIHYRVDSGNIIWIDHSSSVFNQGEQFTLEWASDIGISPEILKFVFDGEDLPQGVVAHTLYSAENDPDMEKFYTIPEAAGKYNRMKEQEDDEIIREAIKNWKTSGAPAGSFEGVKSIIRHYEAVKAAKAKV